MGDRWQDDAEYQRRRKIEWADTGINIDYAAELGVAAYKRWLAVGGGSITPHPEARREVYEHVMWWIADMAYKPPEVLNEGYYRAMAESIADMAAGGSPTTTCAHEWEPRDGKFCGTPRQAWLCKKCDEFGGFVDSGSPTTTPDGKQAFDSPGVLKDAAPTTTPTTEPTEQQVEEERA